MLPTLGMAAPTASAAPAGAAAAPRRLRILALHSFRTSGRTFQLQLQRAGLDRELAELADVVRGRWGLVWVGVGVGVDSSRGKY